ncbi:MAG: hypothetical protein GKR89_34690 [Candidatus Latescibacteria bacterium]|nr:hypothetical protein [Candidatus Latescibacterota bacterium]
MALDEVVKSVHYQAVDPGLKWHKDPAVAIDSDGPLDAVRALTPNVVRMEGGYRLYYHGFGPERPNPESKGYILSAFSVDASRWRKEPGVRLDAGGEVAEDYIWSPDVIPLPAGGYRMYYEGKSERADGRVVSAVVSALSSDGINWERERGIRLGDGETSYGAPRCLFIESGPDGPRYRLYASAFDEHAIVSALSADGLHFALEPGACIAREGALEGYQVYAPEVLRLGDGAYRMYYAGWVAAPQVPAGSKFHGRIFSAFSQDGLQWVKDPEICLDNGGQWDTVKASEPCVIDLDDGRFRMFYEACDTTGQWRIASATSVAS